VLTTAIIGNSYTDSYPKVKVDMSFNNGNQSSNRQHTAG
jgi:hypothetical protein